MTENFVIYRQSAWKAEWLVLQWDETAGAYLFMAQTGSHEAADRLVRSLNVAEPQ